MKKRKRNHQSSAVSIEKEEEKKKKEERPIVGSSETARLKERTSKLVVSPWVFFSRGPLPRLTEV